MQIKSKFDKDLVIDMSASIPCAHIPRAFLAEKALDTVQSYLELAKTRGLNTIDEVLEDMKIKND
jgi:hypothetical protein